MNIELLNSIPDLPMERSAGDYTQDGIIYCGMCRAPRQVAFELFGARMIKNCLCKCRATKNDAEIADFYAKQEIEKIQRRKAAAVSDRTYREWTFDKDDGLEPKMEKIRAYCERWPEVYKDNIGLLLWGDVGTGKSFAAACIANELTNRNVSCLMTTFIRISNELQGRSKDDRNAFIKSLNSYKLLIIDDLGAERSSEFIQEQVFDVIDARYRSGKPLIVTTNLTFGQLKKPDNMTQARIYDRVLEMTAPIRFEHQRRRGLATAKRSKLAQMLGDS